MSEGAKLIQAACASIKGARSPRIARLWLCAMIADRLHASRSCSLELAMRAAIDTLHNYTPAGRAWEIRRESLRRTVQRVRNSGVPRIKLSAGLVRLATAQLTKREKNTEFFGELELSRRKRMQHPDKRAQQVD
jgi:hypothetical protein